MLTEPEVPVQAAEQAELAAVSEPVERVETVAPTYSYEWDEPDWLGPARLVAGTEPTAAEVTGNTNEVDIDTAWVRAVRIDRIGSSACWGTHRVRGSVAEPSKRSARL